MKELNKNVVLAEISILRKDVIRYDKLISEDYHRNFLLYAIERYVNSVVILNLRKLINTKSVESAVELMDQIDRNYKANDTFDDIDLNIQSGVNLKILQLIYKIINLS